MKVAIRVYSRRRTYVEFKELKVKVNDFEIVDFNYG